MPRPLPLEMAAAPANIAAAGQMHTRDVRPDGLHPEVLQIEMALFGDSGGQQRCCFCAPHARTRGPTDRAAFEASLLSAAPCVSANSLCRCFCSLHLAKGCASSLAPVRRSLRSRRTAARLSWSVLLYLLYLAGRLPFGIVRLGGSGSGAAEHAARLRPFKAVRALDGGQLTWRRGGCARRGARRGAQRAFAYDPGCCLRAALTIVHPK